MSSEETPPVTIQTIIKQFPIMLVALDDCGVIRIWNEACETETGYKAEKIINNPQALVILFPERNYREEIIRMWNQQQENSKSFDQIKITCADGKEKYISLTIRIRKNPIISDLHIWGIGQDITEEKKLREDLYNSEIKFKTISKATNDVIWDFDLVNQQLWWGEGIQKVFGFPLVEVEDTLEWWAENLHPDDRERVSLRFNHFIKGEEDFWTDEYRFKRKNGTYAIVEDKGIIIRNGEGAGIRAIGGMVDQTQKRIHEQDLVIRNKQLAEFAFYNSHKIRGPLVRLLSCVELIIIEDTIIDDDLKMMLSQIKISAKEIDNMIKEAGKIIASNRVEEKTI